jgi:hypothetical protein
MCVLELEKMIRHAEDNSSNPMMRSGYAKESIDLSITAPVSGSGHAKLALPKNRTLTGTQGRHANDTVREKGKN